jgi:hypothetical protein
MTIFYPDVYSGQAGISFHGAPVAMVKATQGTGYVNPDFALAKGRAATAGAFFCGYHFLEAGNGAGQARHAFSIAGKIPLMLDFEPSNTRPATADATAFIDEYRKLGGVVHLLYFPHWYWQQLGSPPLAAFVTRKMSLVSSNYTTYSDSGPGWAAYGGMTPAVWQYSASATFNGHNPVDMNAFKGTIDQFKAMATDAAPPPPPDTFPAPPNLHVGGVAVTLNWDPAELSGKPPASYTVHVVQLNGVIAANLTAPTNSALVNGLTHGWTYNVLVWANGGPSAPPHSQITVTV